MDKFPHFEESTYRKTRRQVHALAEIIGKFREALVEPIAKNDNLWLSVVDKGFCTPPMGRLNDLEIGFNLEELIIEIADDKNKYASVSVKGKSASTLVAELSSILNHEFGIDAAVDPAGFESAEETDIDVKDSQEFLLQFINFNSLIKRFHTKISEGVKTQVCLWPHNFDNTFRWFSGKKIDGGDEFIGIGVSNGDDFYELPYIYTSLWPPLRKTNTLTIPEGAFLHDADWTGLMLPYDAIIEKKSSEEQAGLINDFFDQSFTGIKRGFSKR